MNIRLTDQQIRDAIKRANSEAQKYGDDGKPLPEREIADAQLRKVVEWIEKHGYPEYDYPDDDDSKPLEETGNFVIRERCWAALKEAAGGK